MTYLFHESKTSFLDGFINVCISRKEPVVVWHQDVKSAFDLFYEIEPEVVFIEAENLTSGIIRCLKTYKPQVYILVNAYSSLTKKSPFVKYAHLLNRKLLTTTIDLNPKYVSIYEEEYLDKWKDLGINVETIPIGVDNLLYDSVVPKTEYECDIALLEDNSGFDDTIRDWIAQGLNVKLFGKGWHNFPEGVGWLDRREYGNVIMSATKVETINPYTGIEQLNVYLNGNTEQVTTYSQIMDKIL